MKTLFNSLLLTQMLLYTACVKKESNNINTLPTSQSINTIDSTIIDNSTDNSTDNTIIDNTIIDNTINTQTIDYTTSSPIVSTEVSEVSTEVSTTEPTYSESGTTHQLTTIQGENITIIENGNSGFIFPQYAGKIIIFDIIGKDCEYCKKQIPIINRIKKEFPSNIQIVSIQAQGRMSPSAASSLLNQHNINNPLIEGDDAKELLRFLVDTYDWRGILPYILLIKNGATQFTFPDGGVSYKELKESIESLI